MKDVQCILKVKKTQFKKNNRNGFYAVFNKLTQVVRNEVINVRLKIHINIL